MTRGVQLRIDGAQGYGVPLHPPALAQLSEFERGHIFMCLGLDPEQIDCAELAVAAVARGQYPLRHQPVAASERRRAA